MMKEMTNQAARYEAALRASERRFRALIESNADAMVVVDQDGNVCYMNPAAQSLFCLEQDSMARPFGIPLVLDERTEIDIFCGGRPDVVAEMRVTETEWEGEPALLATLRDVSDRKRLEDELRKRAEDLAEVDRRKDEFLATLAHELRNPLAPLRNAFQIMRLAEQPENIFSQLQEMLERQVHHLVRLVDDLTEVSRMTRGRISLHKEQVRLDAILLQAIEASRPLLEGARQPLIFDPAAADVPLLGDPTRLVQVFTNLLNNASKYSPEGAKIEISVRCEAGVCHVAVRDEGIGISPEMLPRVFEAFSQNDPLASRVQGGLGIGLTLVRAIMDLHGGSIEAHSAGLNQGSVFTVRLPALDANQVSTALAAQLASDLKPLPRQARILVVDDNRDSADSVVLLLRHLGIVTAVVYDGATALQTAPAFRPDLVLLDLGMPGMSGFEVARALRRKDASLLLVAMTGWGQEEYRRKGQQAGFNAHLVKPLGTDDLQRLMQMLQSQREDSRSNHVHHDSLKILVIDDSRDTTFTCQMLLSRLGHQVKTAENAKVGYEVAKQFAPDVILCDLRLPAGMDGCEFAQAVRRDPVFQNVFLIAQTGYSCDTQRDQALASGFDLHLTKPVSLQKLSTALSQYHALQRP